MAKGSFFLDFKKFKHVKSDDKSTTLRHPQGHEITIAHKTVSPEIAEQLKAFGKAIKDDESAKMAKGGTVKIHVGSSATHQSEDAPTTDALRDITPAPAHEVEELAADVHKPKAHMTDAPKAYAQGSPSGVAPGDEAPVAEDVVEPSLDEARLDPKNQHIFDITPELAYKTVGAAGGEAPEATALSPSQDGGLSAMQPMAMPPQAEAPQQPMVPQAGGPSMLGGYDQAMAGIKQGAEAQGQLGEEQARHLEDSLRLQQDTQKEFQQKFNDLDAERKAHIADIQAGYIDPEKYWDSHSKVATGIGMILAGFNPTNNPNAAINFLKQQMDMNLQAQAKNLDSKNNLLSANLRQFGNMKDAVEMTRIMQNDTLAHQLQTAAAKAASPLAKAAAMKTAGELQMDASVKAQAFANQQATRSLMATASQDPSKIPQYINALQQTNPEAAKAMAARYVPGAGLAQTEEGAKGVREMQSTVKTAQDTLKRLREITGKTGKSLSPNLRAEADSLRNVLIGALRVPITGPGAMSEGERALLERTIPDVTGLTSLDSNSVVRLNALEKRLQGGYDNMLRANGMQAAPAPAETVKGKDGREYQKVMRNGVAGYVPVKK
jgi:hypothetical protein